MDLLSLGCLSQKAEPRNLQKEAISVCVCAGNSLITGAFNYGAHS